VPTHLLDVGLRGTRDYVQGSQILARTAELVEVADPAPSLLVSAKFTRITDLGVRVVLGGDGLDAEPEIGRAQFARGDARTTARFFEVAGPQARPLADVAPATSDLESTGLGGGQAAFAIPGTFESYLAAVIECVKALHAKRGEQVSDIWFTALVGARLPLAATYPTGGVLRVAPKIERLVAGRLQTLSLVDTESTVGDAPPQFQICFSCVVG